MEKPLEGGPVEDADLLPFDADNAVGLHPAHSALDHIGHGAQPRSQFGLGVPARARYNASYRVTANFLNWVAEKHGKDLMQQLNATIREGKYSSGQVDGNWTDEMRADFNEWIKTQPAL